MNKKIYFNEKFIELLEDDSQSANNQLIKTFVLSDVTKDELKNIMNAFLTDKKTGSIGLRISDYSVFLNTFKELFYYIEAAGGFIENEREFLFIHRHGRWDLPKGKLEKNEKIEQAAIRECEEECGVKNLKIKKQLTSTYHLYAYKDYFAMKQTYWFYMDTDYVGKLVPQKEEDIDEVKWFSKKNIKDFVLNDTYYTIADVVNEGLKVSNS